MFRNMVTSLLRHERIITTVPKAKELRGLADRCITYAKKGSLHHRRLAARIINDPEVLRTLFSEYAERYADRPGGYTRIMKLGWRKGDAAKMAIIELMPEGAVGGGKKKRRASMLNKEERSGSEESSVDQAGGGGRGNLKSSELLSSSSLSSSKQSTDHTATSDRSDFRAR